MKIGDIYLGTDICPDCSKMNMLRKPLGRIQPQGSTGYSTYCAYCPSCEYSGPTYRIREDYLELVKSRENSKIESIDITPYKYGWFGKLFGIFK